MTIILNQMRAVTPRLKIFRVGYEPARQTSLQHDALYRPKYHLSKANINTYKYWTKMHVIAALTALSVSSVAPAAVVTFTNKSLWTQFSIAQGREVAIQSFQTHPEGPFSGACGSIGKTTWCAHAEGSPISFGFFAGYKVMSSEVDSGELNITFTPPVSGIGGYCFGITPSYNVLPVLVYATLADGSSYVVYSESNINFSGFFSTGAPITNIKISAVSAGRLAIDDLYVAVVGSINDIDGDGSPDTTDNCPLIANPAQSDCNSDGIGDVCEIVEGAPDQNRDTIPDTCQCLADLVINQEVNGADLGALLAFWGPVNPALPSADINRDGNVDGADLGYLLNAWGPCPN